MKKILSLLLVFSILVAIPFTVYADDRIGEGGMSEREVIDELKDTLDDAKKSAAAVDAIAKDANALKSVTSTFNDFMSGVSACSTILSAINGSVTFLRLIGVMEDPTQSKLNNITNQVTVMNERLTELDGKINRITDAMSEIKASDDFNARTQNAMTLEQNWNNFVSNYCENGLDKMMSTYDAMCLNGIKEWCNNKTDDARNDGEIDNTYITVLYKKTSAGYRLTFSNENGVPKDFTKDDRWVRIDTSRIAQTVSFDVNNYHAELKKMLLDSVSVLAAYNQSGIEVYNYDELYRNMRTKYQSKYLNSLAEDAVCTLLYRIAASQLNKDATFSKEVIRIYCLYTVWLRHKNSGLDALTKLYFYTHNFECEISNDLTETLNALTIKNAVYGTFAMNVAGASSFATDVEKQSVVSNFANSGKLLRETKKNALTGKMYYSYITGGNTYVTEVEFNAKPSVLLTVYTNGTNKYKGYNNSPISMRTHLAIEGVDQASRATDTQVLLMQYIANSNGDKFDFDYLEKHTNCHYVSNRNYLVTSIEDECPFTIDGSFNLKAAVVSGTYFSNDGIYSTLPSDADSQYMVLRNKLMGNVYNLEANKILSNQPLLASGIYAEHSLWWRFSEVAFLSGSVNMGNTYYGISFYDTGKLERTYFYSAVSHYNEILSFPVSTETSNDSTEYNPIRSFEESLTETIETVDTSLPA